MPLACWAKAAEMLAFEMSPPETSAHTWAATCPAAFQPGGVFFSAGSGSTCALVRAADMSCQGADILSISQPLQAPEAKHVACQKRLDGTLSNDATIMSAP